MTAEPTLPGRLANQVAIVTGGGRGIGRAIADALADAGAVVAVVARSAGEIDETASTIRRRGGRAIAFAADVVDPDAVAAAVSEAEARLGPVSILVNNAGISGPNTPLWETDAADWWRTVEVNLRGPMLCARAVLPAMVRRGRGTIINIGSYAGIRADTGGFSAYATSKAALVRFTDSLAASTREHGVDVFTVSPGVVRTAMTDAIDQFAALSEDAWSPPEQVALLTVRLAAGDGARLNGRFIHVADDLDELVGEAARIEREGLYTLRLLKLSGPEQ